MIEYRNEVRRSGVDARALKSVARRLLQAVDEEHATLSLTLVDDAAIQQINREQRGKDAPTDVLSFPAYDPGDLDARTHAHAGDPIGDVVISIDTARRQAADYDGTLQNEVYRLLIHGILHVLGHDHMEPEERATMEAEERRLADVIGMPWPYDLP